MPNFLVLSNDYTKTDIALYQDHTQLASVSDNAKRASKYLIPLIKELLEKNNTPLDIINFIAINQGPGKFTSLRVLLATGNGLSFATHIPLVGIDGITTLLDEYHSNGITVALLNAFNEDVFYASYAKAPADTGKLSSNREAGYKNIELLLKELRSNYSGKINFIGAGAGLFNKQIKGILGEQAIINTNYPKGASLDFIAQIALKKFQKGETSDQLMPLYLKKPHYKKAI